MNKCILFFAMLISVFCTSCLKSGLEDIENSSLCEISSVTMEHRWIIKNSNGYDQLSRQQLTLSNKNPNDKKELFFSITVPKASSTFPSSERDNVSLDKLYMIMVISPAAKITPLNGAPVLGMPEKYELGKKYEYKVTAANGESSIYTIMIEDFIK